MSARTSVELGTLFLLAAVCLPGTGCKAKPASPDDAALAAQVQTQINGDTPLAGQPVAASVQGGIVTLSGTVLNDAQRTIAARDAAGVAGVKEVRNNLTTLAPQPASQTAVAAPPVAIPVPTTPVRDKVKPLAAAPLERRPAPIEQAYSQQPVPSPTEARQALLQAPPPPPPPPPPRPAFRQVILPVGTTLSVRVTQTLDSASSQQGDTFSGVVTADVVADGLVAIPSGTAVSGHVDEVKDAAHFKGSSLLTISLSSITRHGEPVTVTTDPYSVQGKGRGTNTAEKTGGGAAVGAILGGIFGGGKGAAIGAGAGAGVGAGANAVTRGQQVQIQSESVVRFKTSSPLSLRVRADGASSPEAGGLQPHG